MRLIRLLNHCHHFPGFVYAKARLCQAVPGTRDHRDRRAAAPRVEADLLAMSSAGARL